MTVYCTGILINNLYNSAGSRRGEDAACVSKFDLITVMDRQFAVYLCIVYKCAVKTSKVSDYETLFEFECNETVH